MPRNKQLTVYYKQRVSLKMEKSETPKNSIKSINPEKECYGKVWDSRINVCPASTRTLITPDDSKLVLEEGDEVESVSCSFSLTSEESDSLIDWGSDSTWPDLDIPGTWGTQGLEEQPWDDMKKPVTRFRNYCNLELNEVESKGVLTDRIIAACSSYLDRSPETGKYVLCKVNLSKKLLTDISIMTYHHYLQYVDLSWNELSDVEALGQLPFLMLLDLSHNFLTKVLDFKAPFNLTYVNYSYNLIKKIDDLTNFWSLVHLDISHNHINIIEGLQELKYLRHLNLSYNDIDCIENLNDMKLLTLNLQQNNITRFEEGEHVGFKTLIDILRINLSNNRLKTLKLFEGITAIQSINIMENCIEDLMEITHLRGLNFLTEIDFRGNPIVNMKYYIEVCLNTIKSLYVLDSELVDASKKVLVRSSFETSPYLQAIRRTSKILALQHLNDPILGPAIIPADQPPPPIIILVGPAGSNKAKLVQYLCRKYHKYTILGVSHTNRYKTEDEVDNESYYFINTSKFSEMTRNGEFLTMSQTLGHFFGFAQTELNKTVGRHCAMILHMDLTGALTLRAKGLRCQLVLAMTTTADIHKQWIVEKYYNWHEDSKYQGAVEVENCPTKAKQFLADYDTLSKSSIHAMAKEIVTDLVYHLPTIDDGGEIDADDESYGNRETNATDSIGSVKVSETSPRTSGILKSLSPVSESKRLSLPHHEKISVTFQNKQINTTPSLELQQQERVQSCRSVTFSDVQHLETQELYNSLDRSVSGTVVDYHEQEPALLSVLSHGYVPGKGDSIKQDKIVWDIQTEALKKLVEKIITSRDSYLDIHYSNPGFFSEVVFTDCFEEAALKVKHVLKGCINSQPNVAQNFKYEKDTVYQTMVASRLQALHKETKSEMSTTQKQMNEMGQVMKSIPLQSRSKKSKKELIEKMSRKRHQAVNFKLPTETSFTKQRQPSSSLDIV